ncbi:phosphonate ABC transporter, permease protein PhnE [bacterium]|nr:phosphonate ABC transporter, permease protein PhnE [bacterium]
MNKQTKSVRGRNTPDNQVRPPKSPILAAVLSAVIPGLGQIYAGKPTRGISLLIGLVAQAALFYGVGMPYLAGWIALIWLWNIWDARCLAKGVLASAAGPVILILLLNFIAAWKVTDIHVPSLQSEQRSVIGHIVSGLGNPDFVSRKTKQFSATAKYVVAGPGAPKVIQQPKTKPGEPEISVSPDKVRNGESVTVVGKNFAPNLKGSLILLGADEMSVGSFHTGNKGQFAKAFPNPRYIPGDYFVQARMDVPMGGWSLSSTLKDAAPRMFETIYLAFIGTALSLIFALPLSFLGARNLMSGNAFLKAIYGIVRGLFSVLRSVEVLIIAVIAVAAVGIGPFAGVLALAIHGIGALGKLYSEAIESIEHGPIEAIKSTGASDIQVTAYAVVPQVVPQFIAFTLYRWDINVRMATVIGLVGGGGIGYQLIQYMNLLQWRQAATAIWLIAGVVMLMDYASAVIREKIV